MGNTIIICPECGGRGSSYTGDPIARTNFYATCDRCKNSGRLVVTTEEKPFVPNPDWKEG